MLLYVCKASFISGIPGRINDRFAFSAVYFEIIIANSIIHQLYSRIVRTLYDYLFPSCGVGGQWWDRIFIPDEQFCIVDAVQRRFWCVVAPLLLLFKGVIYSVE